MRGYPPPITTVITPAASRNLTTLADVKAELGISAPDSDILLTRYIAEASAIAERYCNRVFSVETVKDTFLASETPFFGIVVAGVGPLQLSRWPIVTLQPIVEAGITLVAGTDFSNAAAFGQLIRSDQSGNPRRWTAWPLDVTYSAGYSPIPFDVSGAIIRMVKSAYFAQTRDPNLKSETVPGVYSAGYLTGAVSGGGASMPADVAEMLSIYRTPVVA